MDFRGGLSIAMGPRSAATKAYEGGKTLQYDGLKDSPMTDLVHAMGVILSDKSADTTLQLARDLFTQKPREMARITGAMADAFDVAQKHPEASIPRNSTFWDEQLDEMSKLA